jgi:predicted aspartyl protease
MSARIDLYAYWRYLLAVLLSCLDVASFNFPPAALATNSAETIDCVRDRNCLLIPVNINDHKCLMLFDTGADNITISQSTLAAIGIATPVNASTQALAGVGSQNMSALKATASVKVGSHSQENFPLNIQQNASMLPIIGSNFFQGCSVTVDIPHAKIVLDKKADEKLRGTYDSGRNIVGAAWGNQLLIPVIVSGQQTKMLVDSGADGITFNREQARSLHLVVPSDASPEVHMGIAGKVRGVGFKVSEVAVGPLIRKSIKVSVIESPGMPYPLLGADFFKDCIYTIDREHSQLTIDRI